MPIEHMPMTLEEVAGGAAVELFDHMMAKILENIADPNTKNGAKREFSLKFTVKPDEQAYSARVDVEVGKYTLAPIRGASTGALLETQADGSLELLEVQQRQIPMPDNVRTIKED